MNNNSTVSIIIPTYNGEKYLEEALLSVFSQTYKNYEVIVIDDGSVTDGAKKICDKYKDRLVYIRQDNKGLSAARNTGIKNSKGDYVAFLDHDDLWLPEKLEKQVSFLQEMEAQKIHIGLLYSGAEELDENGNVLCRMLYRSKGNNYKALIYVDFVSYVSSVIVPRRTLEEVGLFDEDIKSVQDYDLWIRIAKKYEIYSVDEFLIQYRNRSNSMSRNPLDMVAGEMKILEKILADETKKGSLKDDSKKLMKWYHKKAAMRFKDASYECLFQQLDGILFRKYIRQGLAWDKSIFGFKVWVFYMLSFISSRLCRAIKQLKKEEARDIIIDVNDLKFE